MVYFKDQVDWPFCYVDTIVLLEKFIWNHIWDTGGIFSTYSLVKKIGHFIDVQFEPYNHFLVQSALLGWLWGWRC